MNRIIRHVANKMAEIPRLGGRYFSSEITLSNSVSEYSPPEWVKQPKSSQVVTPKHRVKLAMPNTPIHHWHLPGVTSDHEIYIKRDDMTGSTLSGNKVRKLEFIFADALQQGCKHIITCGGHQSNHCRATASAAAQLGMKCHLFLRAIDDDFNEKCCEGNMFLNRMFGADIYYTPRVAPYETNLKPRMERLAKKIREETGEKAYLLPVGGSTSVGFFGYVEGFRELMAQGTLDNITDIVFACGSGGTAEGLSIGNYLTGSKLKIHPIAVCDNAQYFHDHANETYEELNIKDVKSEDLMDVMEGHKGRGYGISSDDELDFICDVSRKTGIILDATYTGKAALGLVKELKENPQRFNGNKILFIHTGGVFGAYDGTLNTPLLKNTAASKSYSWPETDNPPIKIN